jgi:NTE family protein
MVELSITILEIKQVAPKAKKSQASKNQTSFECIALLLQGGGALGAYQAGVYQALSEEKLEPDWVAGISIGAINAAIIAGNSPQHRVKKLREFWELITLDAFHYSIPDLKSLLSENYTEHKLLNSMSAMRTLLFGIPGFFNSTFPTPWQTQTSYYDSTPLKRTLKRIIDFDRINSRELRFNIGAVNIVSGNFTNFDNRKQVITPEHIMASCALPPGFAPIEIDGHHYWDGGLISNTPLQWVVDDKAFRDTLIFQVDLWSASGEFPSNMAEVMTRQKDIQYSSRTRANTDRFKNAREMRHTIANFLEKLPAELKQLPEAKKLSAFADDKVFNIIHLIYHNKKYEGYVKDFEFSRLSMEEHWKAGYDDTIYSLRHSEILQLPSSGSCISVYDFSKEPKL